MNAKYSGLEIFNYALGIYYYNKGIISKEMFDILLYYCIDLDLHLYGLEGTAKEVAVIENETISSILKDYFVQVGRYIIPNLSKFSFKFKYKSINPNSLSIKISKKNFRDFYPDSEKYSFREADTIYRKVDHFISDKNNYNYLFFGTYYKISQNKILFEKLLKTEGEVLIDDENLLPNNKFAFILMEIRDVIRNNLNIKKDMNRRKNESRGV